MEKLKQLIEIATANKISRIKYGDIELEFSSSAFRPIVPADPLLTTDELTEKIKEQMAKEAEELLFYSAQG